MTEFDSLDVILRRKTGRIVAGIPQLRLYASGKDPAEALDRLEQKKKALIDDLTEVGELESFEVPNTPYRAAAVQASSTREIGVFFVKTAIVAVLIGTMILVPGLIVGRKLEKLADSTNLIVQAEKQRLKEMSGRAFWSRMEAELDRAADPQNAIPEEKKRKILADLKAIFAQWRPFVQEAQILFAPAGDPAASGAVPSPSTMPVPAANPKPSIGAPSR